MAGDPTEAINPIGGGNIDQRCANCVKALAPALKRSFAVQVWKAHLSGRGLKETLQTLSPGTLFDEGLR